MSPPVGIEMFIDFPPHEMGYALNKRVRVVISAIAIITGSTVFGLTSASTAVKAKAEETASTSLVEDYTYPGAENYKDITLIKGDGRITLVDCDANDPTLIKVEQLTKDFCFSVKGDTGWLTLRLEAAFLLGAGDQKVAVKVEGMADPINVAPATREPIQAADPAKKGVIVELRASPN